MPTVSDDLYVTKDELLKYVGPTPADSTFYEWGRKGWVVKAEIKGYYKLNATRAMLKLPLLDIKGYRQELEQNRERHSAA